jgi:Fe2+ transport system protein FeoA
MTLSDCKTGENVKIVKVNAGNGAIRNLANLGLSIGNVVRVDRNSVFQGPVLVFYRETEIAVGHKLAKKIFVNKD